jgi:hypothetical protein
LDDNQENDDDDLAPKEGRNKDILDGRRKKRREVDQSLREKSDEMMKSKKALVDKQMQ